jgi:hypothetical protein
VSGYEIVYNPYERVTIPARGSGVYTASCPFGKVVLGGGYQYAAAVGTLDVTPVADEPVDDNSWRVVLLNSGFQDATNLTVEVIVICAYVTR